MSQLFKALAYQRRLIELNTLMEGANKVKIILKESSLDSDHQDDKYLFGGNLKKKKLSKIAIPKQKSRCIFTSVCHPTIRQTNLFGEAPLSNNQQGSRWRRVLFTRAGREKNLSDLVPERLEIFLFTKNFPYTSSDKKFLYQEYLYKYPPAGRLQFSRTNWEKLTNDSSILVLVKRYRIPFLSKPVQHFCSCSTFLFKACSPSLN